MIYILSFLAGIFYRFSEVEYIWGKHYLAGKEYGWRWSRNKKTYYSLRDWCKGWMAGEIPVQVQGTWQWGFHRMFYSMFEDGYHFFRLLLQITLFILGILWFQDVWLDSLWAWSMVELGLMVSIRWAGTQVGRMLVIKDWKGEVL